MKTCARRCLFAVPPLVVLAIGCQTSTANNLSQADRDAIVQEITGRLTDFKNLALRTDLTVDEALRLSLEFYSDDVVIAGDGAILGGKQEWAEKLRGYLEGRDHMTSWEWRNVHVDALAPDAASATVEFEYHDKRKTGEVIGAKGSWTYVFRRERGKWLIVHNNGTHLPA